MKRIFSVAAMAALATVMPMAAGNTGEMARKLERIIGNAAVVNLNEFALFFERQSRTGLATITDLRNVQITERMQNFPTEIVHIRGYTTDGDHNGVDYKFDLSCTDTDDGGTVIEPTFGPGCWRMVIPDHVPADARWFGAQTSSGCTTGYFDNKDAFDRMEAAGDALSGELDLYFPRTSAGSSYCTTETFFIPGDIHGDGKGDGVGSGIVAATNDFSGSDIILATPGGSAAGNIYRDIIFNANSNPIPAFGNLINPNAGSGDGPSNIDLYENVSFRGSAAPAFTLQFDQFGTTGSTYINIEVRTNAGGRLISLSDEAGAGSDDITFIGARLSMGAEGDNGPNGTPIIINGINTRFIGTFVEVYKYKDSHTGDHAIFNITGGRQVDILGLFAEVPGGRVSDLDYIVRSGANTPVTVDNVWISNSGTADDLNGIVLQQTGALASTPAWSTVVRNVNASNWTVDATIAIKNTGTSASTYLYPVHVSGVGKWPLLASHPSDATSGGEPRLHLTGEWRGLVLDHAVSTDGTTPVLTHRTPRIASNDNFDLINANGAVWRLTCPFDLRVQKAYSVLNAALATGDASITMAIEGVNITGGAITVTQAGSAAGDKDSATPTGASNDNDCDAGETLTLTVGGSSTAGSAGVTVELAPREAA